jgi:hypothetical protein
VLAGGFAQEADLDGDRIRGGLRDGEHVLTKSQVFPQNLLMAWMMSKLLRPFQLLERQVAVSPAKTLARSARKAARIRRRILLFSCLFFDWGRLLQSFRVCVFEMFKN